MNLLLLSNASSDAGYLAHAQSWIADLAPVVGEGPIVFVPFAGVTRDWDDYTTLAAQALAPLGKAVQGVHRTVDPVTAVSQAGLIVVGGGNTFHLLAHVRRLGLLPAITARVRAGTPYLGWSAGANLACPTIRTTNDMPIVDPGGFDALGFVPYQINAHYTTAHPPGHRGETREQRLAEFCAANPKVAVIGLPEGTGLRIAGGSTTLLGELAAPRLQAGTATRQLAPGILEALA